MNYYQKYLKYKMKYLNLKQQGGLIKNDKNLEYINSIGFEIETSIFSPVIIKKNIIHPYGFNYISGSIIRTNISKWFNKKDATMYITQDLYPDNFHLEEDDFTGNIAYTLNKTIIKDIVFTDKTTLQLPTNASNVYGHTEFIITYKTVNKSDNIIYEKIDEILNIIQNFFNQLTIINEGKIKIETLVKNKETQKEEKVIIEYDLLLYKHLDTDTYLLSYYKKDGFQNIEITPQITVGVNINNIQQFIEYLIEDYTDDENKKINLQLYENLPSELEVELVEIFTDNIYQPLSGYFILLYFCFLNTSSLLNYKYVNNTLEIDRTSLPIKPRHKFKNIYNIISKINVLEFNNLKQFIKIKENIEKIRQYRIIHINKLIMKYVKQYFQGNNVYLKKIKKNLNNLWGNLSKEEINIIKQSIKNIIFNHKSSADIDIEEILQLIIDADLKFLNGENDPITSGGTLFDIENNDILLELRYIDKKGPTQNTLFDYINHNKIYMKNKSKKYSDDEYSDNEYSDDKYMKY